MRSSFCDHLYQYMPATNGWMFLVIETISTLLTIDPKYNQRMLSFIDNRYPNCHRVRYLEMYITLYVHLNLKFLYIKLWASKIFEICIDKVHLI